MSGAGHRQALFMRCLLLERHFHADPVKFDFARSKGSLSGHCSNLLRRKCHFEQHVPGNPSRYQRVETIHLHLTDDGIDCIRRSVIP